MHCRAGWRHSSRRPRPLRHSLSPPSPSPLLRRDVLPLPGQIEKSSPKKWSALVPCPGWRSVGGGAPVAAHGLAAGLPRLQGGGLLRGRAMNLLSAPPLPFTTPTRHRQTGEKRSTPIDTAARRPCVSSRGQADGQIDRRAERLRPYGRTRARVAPGPCCTVATRNTHWTRGNRGSCCSCGGGGGRHVFPSLKLCGVLAGPSAPCRVLVGPGRSWPVLVGLSVSWRHAS